MFRASLRPSSGGQTALSLPIVFCPVVAVAMLESRLASCVHCGEGCLTAVAMLESRLASCVHCGVGCLTDGRKDARNMLRNF